LTKKLLAIAKELIKPGMVLWDIGANVGAFTMAAAYMAGKVGKVLAIEPDSWLTSLIRRSAARAAGTVGHLLRYPIALVLPDSSSPHVVALQTPWRTRRTGRLVAFGEDLDTDITCQ
jgi:precorrin-6B methylase 2